MEEGEDSTKRGATFRRDWTEGSIIRNLWSLSWPVMIANSLYTVMQAVDISG